MAVSGVATRKAGGLPQSFFLLKYTLLYASGWHSYKMLFVISDTSGFLPKYKGIHDQGKPKEKSVEEGDKRNTKKK
jgi:hypothetical protein